VCAGPGGGNGTAIQEEEDRGLAGRHYGFEQFFLRAGKIEVGAIPPIKAIHIDFELLILEVPRQPQRHRHHIGGFGGSNRFVQSRGDGRGFNRFAAFRVDDLG
jgi:hypothetical protein